MLSRKLTTAYQNTLNKEAEERDKPAQIRKKLIEDLVIEITEKLKDHEANLEKDSGEKKTSYLIFEEDISVSTKKNPPSFNTNRVNGAPSLANYVTLVKANSSEKEKDEIQSLLKDLVEALNQNDAIKKSVEGCDFKHEVGYSFSGSSHIYRIRLSLDWAALVKDLKAVEVKASAKQYVKL